MISILGVLRDIGVDVDDGEYPQQIHCPFHGGGQEMHMSARVYPLTNSWYCFTEGKSYTPMTTLATAYEITPAQAVYMLRERYGTSDTQPVQSSEKLLPKIADLISCLSMDDLMSDEVDIFLSRVACGYSTATLESDMKSIIGKRWARLV
jgi:hypothetical protein